MAKPRKLTIPLLRQLVLEEKAKILAEAKKSKKGKMVDPESVASKTREIDADEYADTLEKHVDHLAMLKIKESKLLDELAMIRNQKDRVRRRIVRK